MGTLSVSAVKPKSAVRKRRPASLTSAVEKWIHDRRHCDDLVREWQAAENDLATKAKVEGIAFEAAFRKAWVEVKSMNTLMKRIRRLDRELLNAAEAIFQIDATSSEDAMAKILLGLHLRAPSPDDVTAWALVDAGYRELDGFRAKP